MGLAIGFGAALAVLGGLLAGVLLAVRWSRRKLRREVARALRFAAKAGVTRQ